MNISHYNRDGDFWRTWVMLRLITMGICMYLWWSCFFFFSDGVHICGDREACTSASVSKEQAAMLVPYIARFISYCAPEQIRLAPEKCMYLYLREFYLMGTNAVKSCLVCMLMLFIVGVAVIAVCKRFKDQVMLLGTPMRGVAPLQAAVRKLQNSSEHLTTLHPEFLLLCLLAKCYKTGLSILEEDIFEVDQPRDLFLYCYYGWVVSAKTFQLLWLSFLGNSSCYHVHFNLLVSIPFLIRHFTFFIHMV